MDKKIDKKHWFNQFLDISSNFVIELIKKLNKLLNSKKKSGLIRAIIRIICCILLLYVFKIPYTLIGKTVEGIIYLCDLPFDILIIQGWTFIYELIYIIIELNILMITINDIGNKKEFSFELKGSLEKGHELYVTVYKVLRALAIVSLIPIVLLWLMILACLGMNIGLLTHGIYLLGPLLIILGLLITASAFLSYFYKILFNEKGGDK